MDATLESMQYDANKLPLGNEAQFDLPPAPLTTYQRETGEVDHFEWFCGLEGSPGPILR